MVLYFTFCILVQLHLNYFHLLSSFIFNFNNFLFWASYLASVHPCLFLHSFLYTYLSVSGKVFASVLGSLLSSVPLFYGFTHAIPVVSFLCLFQYFLVVVFLILYIPVIPSIFLINHISPLRLIPFVSTMVCCNMFYIYFINFYLFWCLFYTQKSISQ